MNEPYDLYLSYTLEDQDEVRELADALIAEGLRVWDFQRDVKPGDNWSEAVEEALRNSAAMVLLITPQSVKSIWQATEMGAALGLQKLVIPVIAKDTLRKDVPGPLRLRHAIELGDPQVVAGEIAKSLVRDHN